MDLMTKNENKLGCIGEQQAMLATNPITAYHEKKIGKTLYRVTSVYLGKFPLAQALEDLTVKKILRQENAVGSGGYYGAN